MMPLLEKIIIIIIIILSCSCDSNVSYDFSGSTMGTTYLVKIISDKKNPLKIALLNNSVDSLLNEINSKLSNYIEGSEINKFNIHFSDEGFFASNMLLQLIKKSMFHYELSKGDFDITVGPIVKEWGFSTSYKTEMIPDSSIIVKLLNHVGTDKILYKDNYIYKKDPLLEIDLGAIAKGWAVDQIAKYLDTCEIKNYLIEIGGEIVVSGKSIHGNPWKVGISYPSDDAYALENEEIFHVMKLSDMAVATSGTYQNYFEHKDIIYSHIIDPINGFPVKQEIYSATVVSKECVDADAIATAVMVKGALLGMEWIDSLEGTEALFIVKDGRDTYTSIQSKGFSSF